MKTRMTGVGELSRKVLATLVVAAMPGLGFANDVYIEQIGDNTTATITQTGASNVVQGLNTGDSAYLEGDGNTVTINQIGVGNVVKMVVNNPNIGGAGSGTTVTATADGNDNIQTIACGTTLAATCNASTITTNITGNSNRTTQTLSGNAASSIMNITGSYNQVTHTASGAGSHTANITVTGSGVSLASPNTVNVSQTGVTTKNATITSNGSQNNISITQSD